MAEFFGHLGLRQRDGPLPQALHQDPAAREGFRTLVNHAHGGRLGGAEQFRPLTWAAPFPGQRQKRRGPHMRDIQLPALKIILDLKRDADITAEKLRHGRVPRIRAAQEQAGRQGRFKRRGGLQRVAVEDLGQRRKRAALRRAQQFQALSARQAQMRVA